MDNYLKSIIKEFKSKDFKDFISFIYEKMQKEIDLQKRKVDKDKYIKIRKSILGYIVSNERAITSELRKVKK